MLRLGFSVNDLTVIIARKDRIIPEDFLLYF